MELERTRSSIVISSAELKDGETYTLTSDGTTLGQITLSATSTVVDETGAEATASTMAPGGNRGNGGPGGQMPNGSAPSAADSTDSSTTTTTN